MHTGRSLRGEIISKYLKGSEGISKVGPSEYSISTLVGPALGLQSC